MDDISLNLVVLAFFVLLGGGIFYLVRRNQAQNEQNLRTMAAEHGWTYEPVREPLSWGIRLISTHWTLEALSHSSGQTPDSGSSNVAMTTTWTANAPGSTLLIGPVTSRANLGGFGEMLTRQMLQLALGVEAEGLSEIRAGSETLRQKYMVWAQDAALVERILTPALESVLLGWKGVLPLIKRTSRGLTIEIRGVRYKTAVDLTRFVQLGEQLLAAMAA
jgi:hypothetical protein